MEAATRLHEAQIKEHTPEEELTLQLDAFAAECRAKFEDQDVAIETIACIEGAKTVQEAVACP